MKKARIDKGKVRGILSERGMSVTEFTRKAGISRQWFYEALKGNSVTMKTGEKFADWLGVSVDEVTREV